MLTDMMKIVNIEVIISIYSILKFCVEICQRK